MIAEMLLVLIHRQRWMLECRRFRRTIYPPIGGHRRALCVWCASRSIYLSSYSLCLWGAHAMGMLDFMSAKWKVLKPTLDTRIWPTTCRAAGLYARTHTQMHAIALFSTRMYARLGTFFFNLCLLIINASVIDAWPLLRMIMLFFRSYFYFCGFMTFCHDSFVRNWLFTLMHESFRIPFSSHLANTK